MPAARCRIAIRIADGGCQMPDLGFRLIAPEMPPVRSNGLGLESRSFLQDQKGDEYPRPFPARYGCGGAIGFFITKNGCSFLDFEIYRIILPVFRAFARIIPKM